MKNKPLDMYKLIFLTTFSNIKKIFYGSAAITTAPKKIGDFSYQKNIKKVGSKNSFLISMYKNSSGQKAIAKIWEGKVKNFAYYALKNEILAYKVLNSPYARIAASTPAKFKNVTIGKMITHIEKNNQLILVLQHINGTVATDLPAELKLKVYSLTVEFIRYLGNKLTKIERGQLSKRDCYNYIVLYPFLLTKAAITHPKAIYHLLSGIPVFLKAVPILIKNKKNLELVHRDLHLRNILVSNKKIVLIDLQFCVLTEFLHEVVTTLRYRWKVDQFADQLLKMVEKNYLNSREKEILFKGMMVNSATHGLTDNNFKKEKIDAFVDFLKFGIKYSRSTKINYLENYGHKYLYKN